MPAPADPPSATRERTMAHIVIHQFPCLSDNFGVLVHDVASGATAAIDAPEADKVGAALAAKGWRLSHILITHHHDDHTAGIAALKAASKAIVIGPKAEAAKIADLDRMVAEGDTIRLGETTVDVLETPGHTAGHVSYLLRGNAAAFVGDTLFSLGCGRLVEGDARMMWRSLRKLSRLPAETALYCGHEYTAANARFALQVEPGNATLVARAAEVDELRRDGKPTLPTTLGAELAANPFLRPSSVEIRRTLGMAAAEDWQVFAELRERKNRA